MDADEPGGLEQGLRTFSDCLASPGMTSAPSLAHGVFTVPDTSMYLRKTERAGQTNPADTESDRRVTTLGNRFGRNR